MRTLNMTIAIGAIAALIGAGLVYAYGQNVNERIAEGRATVAVVVATEDLARGTPAEALEDSVEVRAVPRAYVAAGALRSLEDVAGEVLAGPVAEGAQLTRAQFGSPQELALLQPSLGHVAVAVGVDLSPGVARYLQPGSFVDVFVTYDQLATASTTTGVAVQPVNRRASNRTKLFISGARVLSVTVAPTTEREEDRPAGAFGTGGSTTVTTDGVIAVLDVSPRDAERLVNATTLGQLYLALSQEDAKHTTPRGVTPDDVVRANR